MSKTTKRYGPVTFYAHSAIAAVPDQAMRDRVTGYLTFLDHCGKVVFGRPYRNLVDRQKTAVHEALNRVEDSVAANNRKLLFVAGLVRA